MQWKTAVLWSIVNEEAHEAMEESDTKIKALMPLVEALFPGVNYYSLTGFNAIMHECVMPALQKQFAELKDLPAEEVDPEEMREVAEVMPSDGYEWQDSSSWQSNFEERLAAA